MLNVSSDGILAAAPNFFNPIALLPSEEYEKTIVIYIPVGLLAILVWDILTHLGADYKLLTQYKINLPTVVYIISRWSSLLYSLCSVIFKTAPVEKCLVLSRATCSAYHVAVSSTAFLFFLRVRAVFGNNKYVTAAFFVMWLAVVGGSLTVITSFSGDRVGSTKYCTFATFNRYGSSSNIIIAIFDTCVFVAISWRLVSMSQNPARSPGSSGHKFAFLGRHLPTFSRALIQDGQTYYLVAMTSNLLVLVMTYLPAVPVVYRTMFLVPTVDLTSVMGCRVFRHTKLGLDRGGDLPASDIVFRRGNVRSAFAGGQMRELTAGAISDKGNLI